MLGKLLHHYTAETLSPKVWRDRVGNNHIQLSQSFLISSDGVDLRNSRTIPLPVNLASYSIFIVYRNSTSDRPIVSSSSLNIIPNAAGMDIVKINGSHIPAPSVASTTKVVGYSSAGYAFSNATVVPFSSISAPSAIEVGNAVIREVYIYDNSSIPFNASDYYSFASSYNRSLRAYPTASAPWTPLALSPAIWLRADLGVSIATGVSQWADQSGNGRHFAQASGVNQPTLVANSVGGQSSINFDGASQNLTCSSLSGIELSGDVSWWLVAQHPNTGTGAYQMMFEVWNGSGHQCSMYSPTNAGGTQLRVGSTVPVAASILANQPVLYANISASGSNNSKGRANNTVVSYTRSGVASTTQIALGGHYIAGVEPWTGKVAELIICQRTASAGEQSSVLSYLNSRYFSSWS